MHCHSPGRHSQRERERGREGGGESKKCIANAWTHGADINVFVHPKLDDGQQDLLLLLLLKILSHLTTPPPFSSLRFRARLVCLKSAKKPIKLCNCLNVPHGPHHKAAKVYAPERVCGVCVGSSSTTTACRWMLCGVCAGREERMASA